MKTATEKLESLTDLNKNATYLYSHLRNEIVEIMEEWEGITRAGGGRDDHAAKLLERLHPHFVNLETFFHRCGEQCLESIKNPFAR